MEKVTSTFSTSSRSLVSDTVVPVVVKNPADFVGSALGESEKNTKAILDTTVGKVLVIDEVSIKCPPFPIPTNRSLRHMACMVEEEKAVVVCMIRTKPRLSTRSLPKFRVCRAKTDVSCFLAMKIRWWKCFK